MSIKFRILLYLVTLLSIVFMPWWVSTAIIFFSMIFINRYFEGIIFAFIADIIFRNPTAYFSWWFTITAIILLLLFEGVIKRKFRFYTNAV